MDFLFNIMIFSLIWRLIWRVPGGIWTLLVIAALIYFWRRGTLRLPRFGGRRAFDPTRDRRAPAMIAGLTLAYGKGSYQQGGERHEGRIQMSRDKLYLVNDGGEIGPSFVPVGKIMKLSRNGGQIDLEVVLSLTEDYHASYFGERERMKELAEEIVQRRGLKKSWFSGEYKDPDHD